MKLNNRHGGRGFISETHNGHVLEVLTA